MKLIITVGAGEIGFLYYLLKHMGYNIKVKEKELYKFEKSVNYQKNELVENIYILNLDGHGNLDARVLLLMKDADFKNIKSISFLVDAENNYITTVDRYSKKLEEMKNSEEANIQYTSLFISPDQGSSGMLEDLVLESLMHQNIRTHIVNETIPQLEIVKNSNIKNKSKATLMIYSASQNSLEGKIHRILGDIPAESVDFNSEKLDGIKNFVQNIIDIPTTFEKSE